MSARWHPEELAAIAAADELLIASRRADGSLSPAVTVWCVALHGVVIVRSAYGAENGWYRRALARGAGRISAGGVERDVVLQPGDRFDQRLVDEEYRGKYARYPDAVVRTVVGEQVHGLSIIVTPVGGAR
jgi:hypothetical protein